MGVRSSIANLPELPGRRPALAQWIVSKQGLSSYVKELAVIGRYFYYLLWTSVGNKVQGVAGPLSPSDNENRPVFHVTREHIVAAYITVGVCS